MPTNPVEMCVLCGHDTFKEFSQSMRLKSVTSDCKFWDCGGIIEVCEYCGHIQKRMDPLWREEVSRIYANYTIYHLSEGKEQVVFDDDSSAVFPRSLRIFESLEGQVNISEQGCLMDVGCGNGELLCLFNKKYPGWVLAGYEQDEKCRGNIVRIPGVRHFYSGEIDLIDQIDQKFDFITLMDVLEHVFQPVQLLKQLRSKLVSGGMVLVHVPDYSQNPFDLLVMDHCSHFTPETLIQTARHSGFEVRVFATDWIPRYITVVLCVTKNQAMQKIAKRDPKDVAKAVAVDIKWLEDVVEHARKSADKGELGVFGTAIAGTWLAGRLGSLACFFVDEDPMRLGKTHMGREVIHPFDVLENNEVYLPVVPEKATQINNRFKRSEKLLKLILPPMFSSKL
ncbi:MAG: methyltransferase domain-containing protein [Candidatus Omnitrophota bacterium]